MRRAAVWTAAPLVALLLVLPAGAAESPGALLDEAAALLDRVPDASPGERVELLAAAQEFLLRIERDHPGSGIARALARGETVRHIDPDAVSRSLRRARTVPALTLACAERHDRRCVLANAAAVIEDQRLDARLEQLGRAFAGTGALEEAALLVRRLERDGDQLGASEVTSAIVRRHAAAGREDQALRLVEQRLLSLNALEDPATRTHRLVSFALNLLGDGEDDLARTAFAAGRDAAREAIAAVPPSAATEAVLVIYEAQALAGLGQSADAIALLDGLETGPVKAGWHALGALLGRTGEVAALRTIASRPAFVDDWRIRSALVDAQARSGDYRAALDRAGATERAGTRWLRLRSVAAAMADRGDTEEAADVLARLGDAAAPQQLLGLAALWLRIGRPKEAAGLRTRGRGPG